MKKIFEEEISILQANMLKACLKYVNYQVDVVYIYCCNEDGTLLGDYFYKINNKMYMKHKINEAFNDYSFDVSSDSQGIILDVLLTNIEAIERLCKRCNQKIPTEMKIIYNLKTNELNINYAYQNIWSEELIKLPQHIVQNWFDELKMN